MEPFHNARRSISDMRCVPVAEELGRVQENPQGPASQQDERFSANLPTLDPTDPSFYLVLERLEAYLKPPAPSPPVNDIFLCPPLTNQSFKPRKFDTPEEEEAWWSDPWTWPGDHLIIPAEATPKISSLSGNDAPRSYIDLFSPEPSEHGDNDENAPLSHARPSSVCGPRHLSICSEDVDESDASAVSISDGPADVKTEAPDTDVFADEDDAVDDEVEEEIDQLEGDSSSDWDEYTPGTPPHHTRPGPSRRTAPKPRPLRRNGPPPRPPRVHKPHTTIPKAATCQKPGVTRRGFHEIPPDELKKLRDEQTHLKNSGQAATPFEVQHPISQGEGKKKGWYCVHVKDGVQCSAPSASRMDEGRRHMLTHLNVRFLCSNPKCGRAFSRDDAVNRHILASDCKKRLPQGVAVKDPKDVIVMEGQSFRLVRLVWLGEPERKRGKTTDKASGAST